MSKTYDSSSIKQLTGLSAIRLRPGMYVGGTGTDGFHHILWEVIDNSVDEYLAGHCNRIRVHIDTHGNVATIEDNGRGIPTTIHKQTQEPTMVSVLTKLHMGGKFEQGGSYTISGGLHGIGAKATCALSDRMIVWSCRRGKVFKAGFSRGKLKIPMKVVAKTKNTGTKISFRPDPEIFGKKLRFDLEKVRSRLQSTAYLCKGLEIMFRENKNKPEKFYSEEGISGLLSDNLGSKEKTVFDEPLTFNSTDPETGEGIDVSLWWTDGDGEEWHTYVNMISVPDGGTHVTGAKTAITREMKKLCDKSGVTGDDFREGIRVVCHIKLMDPQFEGQTKNRLNNPEMTNIADKIFSSNIRNFLIKNSATAKKLISRAVEVSKARAAYRAGKRIATQTAYAKDPNSRRGLPFKLVTALNCKPEERETFIVEGSSAGGSAKMGRNGKFQEILPLRGKIPNTVSISDTVKLAKLFENEEIDSIVRAIGAGHDVEQAYESCNPKKARQHKIILLTDADADGGHIDALLIAFFLRFMLPLVEEGYIYVALPPLFAAKWGEKRVYGDSKEDVLAKAAKAGAKNPQISRFKGLGEMNPKQLAETSMDPKSRRLLQLKADRSSVKHVMELMGTDAGIRKKILGLS